ncbi:hypothetical protein AJ80_00265 [Polytolypa hystricis UAMH7299]|uniref:Amidase domain-containing protein n=1 Tax=Polytolypa hystricis (strain UAMH7299) TaxID=1447883 RepID=A0A2B7Z3M7_POLH7|nr:hypothetical protein AJ80_00265 [Polytolypa hystricis UAMH7299]
MNLLLADFTNKNLFNTVLSQLYYKSTVDKLLAGIYLGVKDIYYIKGIKTSSGNCAYYYLYRTQNNTSPAIQRLLDLGAVFVGKTGTVQFANRDRPTDDWVDYHCPYNPRGDGYQAPGGSSSGSGASIGAYSWLDAAIGSDTGGSMRSPAAQQGIYGNRPSTGAISLDHVLPLSPALDTAGIFTRTPSLWAKATKAWYPDFASNYTSLPSKLYLDGGEWDGEGVTPEAHTALTTFAQKLEAYLHAKTTKIDVAGLWQETHPEGSDSMGQLLDLSYAFIVSVDQFNLLGRSLFNDYGAAHGGRRPFVNPGPLARWMWGQSNGADAQHEIALKNMTTFRDWWETDGYGKADPASCSEGLIAYVYGSGSPDYRNTYHSPPTTPPLGFGTGRISVLAGSPEVVVPIGESPYNSTISLQKEYLPVAVALQMARGSDNVLADLVEGLGKEGILKDVVTGPRIWE